MAWRKVAVMVVAAAGSLLLATPPAAAAVVPNLHLKDAHQNKFADDPEFDETGEDGDCEDDTADGGPLEGLTSSQDGWHFTWPQGGDFLVVTLTFDDPADADPAFTVVISSTNPAAPDTNADPAWSGFIGSTGSGEAKFVWLITEAGWELIDGSATSDPTDVDEFNLSHTCPGTPPMSAAITSQVHRADHTNILNASAPAGSTVHDQVTLTVTGLDDWSGTLRLDFFTNGECFGDPEPGTLFTAWDQDTGMPQDNLLPKGPLGVGAYSYQESFHFDSPNDNLDVVGECEPFTIVAQQTTTTTSPPGEHPPTGVSLTALIMTGAALVAGGAALIVFRRRRDAAEHPLA